MQLHLGDLPTWFAAVGTVGALGAALFQIKTDRDRQHTREHVAQAQRISSFIEGPVREPQAPGDPLPTGTDILHLWAKHGSTALTVINASVEPVYTVILGIVWTQRGGGDNAGHIGEAR